MKRKAAPQGVVDLPPEEWDFRGITREELPYAIFYEYERTRLRLQNPTTKETKSWSKLSISKRKQMSNWKVRKIPIYELSSVPEWMTKLPENHEFICHILCINWTCTKPQLVDSFERWLSKRLPQGREWKSKAGRTNVAPFEWLKWLAALRLDNAGVAFTDANNLLARRKLSDHAREDLTGVLECYGKKRAWTDAVEKARDLMVDPHLKRRISERCWNA
jgi:hypothetical protein